MPINNYAQQNLIRSDRISLDYSHTCYSLSLLLQFVLLCHFLQLYQQCHYSQ